MKHGEPCQCINELTEGNNHDSMNGNERRELKDSAKKELMSCTQIKGGED